jgi:hypothetical protein
MLEYRVKNGNVALINNIPVFHYSTIAVMFDLEAGQNYNH